MADKHLRYENGDEYVGETDGNVREGYGTYVSKAGKLVGTWHLNQLNGTGKMITDEFVYEGEFVLSVREGRGVETHTDGTVYEGQFLKGKKHGEMKVTLPNKATIRCHYENGYGVGTGVMTMTDGEIVPVRLSGGKVYFIKTDEK